MSVRIEKLIAADRIKDSMIPAETSFDAGLAAMANFVSTMIHEAARVGGPQKTMQPAISQGTQILVGLSEIRQRVIDVHSGLNRLAGDQGLHPPKLQVVGAPERAEGDLSPCPARFLVGGEDRGSAVSA